MPQDVIKKSKDFVVIPLELYSSGLGFAAMTIYSYLYYKCSSNPTRDTGIKNSQLKDKFNVDLKTIKKALQDLKKNSFIEITGKTANRRIRCIDPFEININA